MDPSDLSLGIHLVAGSAVLFMGRRLFWLFVGVAGFVLTSEAVPQVFPDQPEWIVLAVALVVGIAGAVLAIVLQYLAVALAGIAVGVYGALSLQPELGLPEAWWVPVVGGAAGALVGLLVLDWGLILLSAVVGAGAVSAALELAPPWGLLLWGLLLAAGVSVQASMRRGGRARPKRAIS